MERTKEYSVVNDTLKALKNQGLSERYFQKGHSFSSATSYDHLSTSPKMDLHRLSHPLRNDPSLYKYTIFFGKVNYKFKKYPL